MSEQSHTTPAHTREQLLAHCREWLLVANEQKKLMHSMIFYLENRMGAPEWKREKLYELKVRVTAMHDSKYDTQLVQLIDILMEPEHDH